MIPFFTILHPLVDAYSVTVQVVGGMSFQRVTASPCHSKLDKYKICG